MFKRLRTLFDWIRRHISHVSLFGVVEFGLRAPEPASDSPAKPADPKPEAGGLPNSPSTPLTVAARVNHGLADDEADRRATAFFRQVIELATQVAPALRMGDPNRPRKAKGWPELNRDNRLSLTSYMHIKPEYPYVDLHISNWAARLPRVREVLEPTLESGMSIVEGGKSATFRIAAPKLDPVAPFEGQRDAVLEVLRALSRLQAWYQKNLPKLDQLGQELSGRA